MIEKEKNKRVAEWLKDISASLGVELTLSEEGICSFQVGDDTIITLEVSEDFPEVYIYSPLQLLPSDNVEEAVAIMSKALEINAFQALTRGGAIALAPGGGLLIFCYSTPIEGVDSEIFSRILGSFFETAVDLKKILSEPIIAALSKDIESIGQQKTKKILKI